MAKCHLNFHCWMQKPNLLYWYYNQGVNELLEIWKNFLIFVWQYFSIKELFVTLFSPWRRDIAVSNWRGLHPIRTLGLLFENILSRLLGSVVRSFVIFFGLIFFAFTIVLGLFANILWIGAPLIWIGAVVFSLSNGINLLYPVAMIVVWLLVILSWHLQDTKKPMLHISLDELAKHHVFARVCARLGIARKHFPAEILENKDAFEAFLKARNLTQQEYSQILKWELERRQKRINASKFWLKENLDKISKIGRQWKFGYTVNLDRYCVDLSHADYSEYANCELIGRENEYEILKLILQRPDQNCALLVGNNGVGRKTMIHWLAQNIRTNKEESIFPSVRLLSLDLGRAISDVVNSGEDVENFLRRLLFEAARAGNVILIIEHLEHFLGVNSNVMHPDISAVLEEFLNVPSLRIIATSTSKEYHQLIESHVGVTKYFEVIEMREPSAEDAVLVLLNHFERYEKRRVLFTFKALKKMVVESEKHNWEFPLPERAIDLAMGTLMFWEKKSNEEFVSEKVVDEYLSLKTGVPQGDIEGVERKKLMNLEALLHRQVIGQNEAIDQVSSALRRARAGVGNSEKPVGSFLFLGPTGVGKTETAKALAKIYFGSVDKMIRLDMSEFQSPNSIDRLLGSSQLNQQGRLVSQIKDNPYSLLLLDEIEKAYPELLDVFLQILDEGYVNDAFGNKISFRNTMIIATSNAGSSLIKNMAEQNAPAEEIKKAVIDHAIENNIFRTEFLNRFEGVVFFRPLKENELRSVVRLQLQKFIRKISKEKNIQIDFDENVIDQIIQKGYDPIFGARSLHRYMEETIEDLVAKKIISGEVAQGEKIMLSL